MKFTAEKTDLIQAVNKSSRAVSVHSTMSILQCILIRTRGNQLSFTGNDTELGIETVIPAMIDEEGEIAVEAKMISEIVRRLPTDTVMISTDANYTMTIVSGKARFTIPGRSGGEFTDLPEVEMEDSISMSQFSLKNMILSTIFSVSLKDSSKIMTGECFEIDGDILRVIALDGHRISMRREVLQNENNLKKRVIIPGKTLSEVSRILSGEMNDTVQICFSRNHVIFLLENTRIVSSLIDGEYYNVDQMISTDYETKLTISRGMFMSCIERAVLFVKESDKKPIVFDIDGEDLGLSVDSPLGSFSENLPVVTEGRNLMIGFNPRFLLDALRVIDDENVTMYLVNSKAPCFIRSDDNSYTYIVLPINFMR